MTDEEKRKRLRYLQLKQKQAASGNQTSRESTPAPAPKEQAPYMSAADTIRGGIQALGQGQTFGWQDEIVGAGRMAVDQLVGDTKADRLARELEGDNADRPNYSDTYRMYRDDERTNLENYKKNNPGTALGLEMTGALISPVPGPAKGAGLTKTVLRAGAEGAAYGAGMANEVEDIPKEAAGTAGTAMAFAGALRGAQGVGNQFAKKRISRDLVEGGKRVPAWIADEVGSPIGDFYRGFMGRNLFSRGKMRTQEAPFIQAADDALTAATHRKEAAMSALNKQATEIADAAKESKRAIDRTVRRKKGGLSSVERKAVGEIGERLDDATNDLLAKAAQESIPTDFRATALAGANLKRPQEVATKLLKFWRDDAFREVKGRAFDWDVGIVDRIKKQFEKEPDLFLRMTEDPEMVGVLARRFGLDIASQTSDNLSMRISDDLLKPSIQIQGDALMELRNWFAKNTKPGADNFRSYSAIKGQLDDMIVRQLDDAAARTFRETKEAYPTFLAYKDATRAAKLNDGIFDASQWLTAAAKRGDTFEMKAPLQGAAQAVNRDAKRGEKLIKTAAARRSVAEDRLTRRADAQKLRADRAKDKATRELDVSGSRQRYNDARRDAVRNKRELNAKTIPENPSGLSSWLTTRATTYAAPAAMGAVGLGVGGPAGAALGFGLGYAGSRGLVTNRGQDLLAGQTGVQNWMRNLSENDRARLIARYLRNAAARESAVVTGE